MANFAPQPKAEGKMKGGSVYFQHFNGTNLRQLEKGKRGSVQGGSKCAEREFQQIFRSKFGLYIRTQNINNVVIGNLNH